MILQRNQTQLLMKQRSLILVNTILPGILIEVEILEDKKQLDRRDTDGEEIHPIILNQLKHRAELLQQTILMSLPNQLDKEKRWKVTF